MKQDLKKLVRKVIVRADNIAYPYEIFGIFGVISYFFYYLLWVYVATQGYENFYIRLVATLLCIPLLLKKYWPIKFQQFLPLYWYLALFYCLPFFFTFMLLKNNFSYGWVLNTLTGIVLGILVLDLAAFIIMLPTGILLGWLVYKLTTTSIILAEVDYATVIITYTSVIIFGALFAHRKEKIHIEKLQTMRLLGTNIAHELRTPLAAINMTADGVKEYWPHLIDGYNLAKQHELPVRPLRTSQFNIIQSSIDDILAEAHYANSIINMLLLKTNEFTLTARELKNYSIADCISEALRRYPFAEGEKKLIHLNAKIDFVFKGNELFMIHVLFNLLKNALYYIHAARKGEIYITLERGQSFNRLIFRDTGSGIPAKYIKHLFDRFFSKTHGGTGLGLTFAKMVMQGFGGDIVCRSKEGEFTEFTLSFPVLPEAEFNIK